MSVSSGGTDAICIAYIAVTDPTNAKRLFLGDIAAHCGADWYLSSLSVQDVHPKCFWLDSDHTNGAKYSGIGIHMPSFSSEDEGPMKGLALEYNTTKDAMCNSAPRLKLYEDLRGEDPIMFFDPPFTGNDFNPDGSDKDLTKIIGVAGSKAKINRKLSPEACKKTGCPHIWDADGPGTGTPAKVRRSNHADKLVISHFAAHSAAELCGSETSKGPDFVSMREKIFCDMENKISRNLCSDSTSTCCFDFDVQQMRQCGFRGTSASKRASPNKSYSKVHHWGA